MKFAVLAAGLSIVAVACGSDKGSKSSEPPATTPVTSPATTTPGTGTGGTQPVTSDTTGLNGAAMTVTYEINPDAVWEDGSPITAADFECTWQANLNTPGSIGTTGYDKITAVAAGSSDKEVVASFSEQYAPYKNLFSGLIKKAAVKDCNDVSQDFATELPISGREWKIQSWSETQSILVPNDKYWGDKPTVSQLIMVPKLDSDTEIASLKAGEVDFIYPQYSAGTAAALQDPNIKTKIVFGGDYEAIYMNLAADGPFADKVFREAFYKSIDLDALFTQIYTPIVAEGKLLTCGPMVPGPYCPTGIFGNKFDEAGAAKLLTDAGYAKDSKGFWAKGGDSKPIRWMINTGNTRRENTQAYLIPLLQKAGFNVVADNCDADCVFQQRLPAADYDLAMYISTAPPDPSYLVPSFAGDQIPTEANNNQGQNFQNWNNATATKALHDSDKEVDDAKRVEEIQTAIKEMDKDYILIPTFQFPKSGAYRTDKVDNVEGQLANYRAFSDTAIWKDVDGDGKIVIGAEQWPSCLNPVTECANSSWYVWTVAFPVLPNVFDTTNDGLYKTTNLVTGDPVVKVAGS